MSNPFDKLKSSLNDLIFEEDNKEEKIEAQTQEQEVEQTYNDFGQNKSFKEPEEKPTMIFEEENQKPEESEVTPVAEIKPVQTSVITEGTALTGNIRTESHVKIEGSIQGNIDTTANITIVGGEVVGDIRGGMVGAKTATVKGNITSNDIVEILEESYIEGNIIGDKIYVAGRIMGNISSSGILTLSCDAVIEGDIITKKLRMEDGSIINGRITMNR